MILRSFELHYLIAMMDDCSAIPVEMGQYHLFRC